MTKDISRKIVAIDDFADVFVGEMLVFPDGRREVVFDCATSYVITMDLINNLDGKYLQKSFYNQGEVGFDFKPSLIEKYKLNKNFRIK